MSIQIIDSLYLASQEPLDARLVVNSVNDVSEYWYEGMQVYQTSDKTNYTYDGTKWISIPDTSSLDIKLSLKANDTSVMHLDTDESINGVKTFNSTINFTGGINVNKSLIYKKDVSFNASNGVVVFVTDPSHGMMDYETIRVISSSNTDIVPLGSYTISYINSNSYKFLINTRNSGTGTLDYIRDASAFIIGNSSTGQAYFNTSLSIKDLTINPDRTLGELTAYAPYTFKSGPYTPDGSFYWVGGSVVAGDIIASIDRIGYNVSSGTFLAGDTVIGSSTGATSKVKIATNSYDQGPILLTYDTSGSFAKGESIIGAPSGATGRVTNFKLSTPCTIEMISGVSTFQGEGFVKSVVGTVTPGDTFYKIGTNTFFNCASSLIPNNAIRIDYANKRMTFGNTPTTPVTYNFSPIGGDDYPVLGVITSPTGQNSGIRIGITGGSSYFQIAKNGVPVNFYYNTTSTPVWSINGGTQLMQSNNGNIIFNYNYLDNDFIIRSASSGEAYVYDAGLKTHTINASNNLTINGSTFINGTLTLSNKRISGVLSAVNSSDAINKYQFDSSILSLNIWNTTQDASIDLKYNKIGGAITGDVSIIGNININGALALGDTSSLSIFNMRNPNKFNAVFQYVASTGSYVDNTISSYTSTPASPFNVLDSSLNYLYVGSTTKFNKINFAEGTQSGSGYNLRTEYWDGSGWVEMSSSDGTVGFVILEWNQMLNQQPIIFWNDASVSSWTTTTVNDVSNLYWVRVKTTTTPTIPYKANLILPGDVLPLSIRANYGDQSNRFNLDYKGFPEATNLMRIKAGQNLPFDWTMLEFTGAGAIFNLKNQYGIWLNRGFSFSWANPWQFTGSGGDRSGLYQLNYNGAVFNSGNYNVDFTVYKLGSGTALNFSARDSSLTIDASDLKISSQTNFTNNVSINGSLMVNSSTTFNGPIIIQSSFNKSYLKVSNNTTLDDTNLIILCNSTNNFNITLPSASMCDRRIYTIKNINTGKVTVLCSSPDKIDGSTEFVLDIYDAIDVLSDASNWFIL